MNDPYEFLGLSRNASDSEIKAAYKQKAKENDGNEVYMRELDSAYDLIMSMRSDSEGQNSYYDYGSSSSGRLGDVRAKINSGKIDDADYILESVPVNDRNAEWNYLKGVVFKKRGWLEAASEHFKTACEQAPSNEEYRAEYQRIRNEENANFESESSGSVFNGCRPCACESDNCGSSCVKGICASICCDAICDAVCRIC